MSRRTHRSSPVPAQPPSASASGEQAAAVSISGPDPLVGQFFHSFHPEGKYRDAPTPPVNWQGHVLARVNEQTYRVEVFSWMTGEPNGQRLVPVAEMVDWKFYPTADEMNAWYEHVYARRVRDYSFEVAE
jgi:hypothetical protein